LPCGKKKEEGTAAIIDHRLFFEKGRGRKRGGRPAAMVPPFLEKKGGRNVLVVVHGSRGIHFLQKEKRRKGVRNGRTLPSSKNDLNLSIPRREGKEGGVRSYYFGNVRPFLCRKKERKRPETVR